MSQLPFVSYIKFIRSTFLFFCSCIRGQRGGTVDCAADPGRKVGGSEQRGRGPSETRETSQAGRDGTGRDGRLVVEWPSRFCCQGEQRRIYSGWSGRPAAGAVPSPTRHSVPGYMSTEMNEELHRTAKFDK